jgi:hypothetical protein
MLPLVWISRDKLVAGAGVIGVRGSKVVACARCNPPRLGGGGILFDNIPPVRLTLPVRPILPPASLNDVHDDEGERDGTVPDPVPLVDTLDDERVSPDGSGPINEPSDGDRASVGSSESRLLKRFFASPYVGTPWCSLSIVDSSRAGDGSTRLGRVMRGSGACVSSSVFILSFPTPPISPSVSSSSLLMRSKPQR